MALNFKQTGFALLAAGLVLAFFYFVLGFSGMMTILGVMLLFILPFYMILDNFELDKDEKIVFAFFIGIGIFPAISYWLGMLISFRIAIFVTFALLVATSFIIKKFKKRQAWL